jgi:hypothetical protein
MKKKIIQQLTIFQNILIFDRINTYQLYLFYRIIVYHSKY